MLPTSITFSDFLPTGIPMAPKLYPMWPPGVVETVCKVLAATDWPGAPHQPSSRDQREPIIRI